ncbi:MAG TPA: nuclear transport factor 2 family protein [Candidatus Binatia bacterium]|nr:nuclear transport factor 2 family protein [Candidatus Binatia bacterium]
MDDAAKIAFARRFFDAVARGDLDEVRRMYAPNAVIWTSQDPGERCPDENLAVLGWIKNNVENFRYEDVRCQPTPTGFVEQHTTCGTTPGGADFRFPACLVVRIENEKITRLEEYFDTAPLTAALSRVSSA